jgi:hypothetical protein
MSLFVNFIKYECKAMCLVLFFLLSSSSSLSRDSNFHFDFRAVTRNGV